MCVAHRSVDHRCATVPCAGQRGSYGDRAGPAGRTVTNGAGAVAWAGRPTSRPVLDAGRGAIELARATGVHIGFGTDLMGALEDEQLTGLRRQMEADGPVNALQSA